MSEPYLWDLGDYVRIRRTGEIAQVIAVEHGYGHTCRFFDGSTHVYVSSELQLVDLSLLETPEGAKEHYASTGLDAVERAERAAIFNACLNKLIEESKKLKYREMLTKAQSVPVPDGDEIQRWLYYWMDIVRTTFPGEFK